MKKYLASLLIILLMMPLYVGAVYNNDPRLYRFDFDYLDDLGDSEFYKIDSEGNIIDEAEFKIRDLNNKVQYDVNYDSHDKRYKSKAVISNNYNEIINFIPSNVKDIVTNFNKMDDFRPYAIGIVPKLEAASDPNTYEAPRYINMEVACKIPYVNSDMISNAIEKYPIRKLDNTYMYENCIVTIPVLAVLEETKTPKGFEKATEILPSTVMIKYDFDLQTGNISSVSAALINEDAMWGYYGFIDYEESVDYDKVVDYLNNLGNDTSYADKMCLSTCDTDYYCGEDECPSEEYKERVRIINKFIEKYGNPSHNEVDHTTICYPILIDKAGHSDISINSYVNSEEEVNLTESGNVQIKVFLKNQGAAPSYNNVVISEVPEGVEYVEGSANANGVYNPDDRTVTWNLEYLDAHDGYIFAYDVAVTTGKTSNIYVTTSSVTSNENTAPVESNEARVTTPGMRSEDIPDNPKTGDERMFVIILGLLIGFTIMFYVHSKRIVKL